MIAGTHVAFGSALYLGGGALFGYRPDWLGWVLVSLTSVVPDVDLPTSRLGRTFFFLSVPLERNFGHRTITHSFVGLAVVALLISPLLLLHQPFYFWCILGGLWSHLWIDMLNRRGVDLFWPSPVRVVMPGNRDWRMEVGSKPEMILLIALILLTAGVYPLSSLGFRGSLQLLVTNFDIAREQFLREAGTRWFNLDLEATDNLTLQRVKCECPVLGAWQNGLIVLHNGKSQSVGESQLTHNLYPLKAKLIEGPPLTVVTQRVDMRGRNLRWLLSKIDRKRTYYLLGEMQIAGDKIVPVSNIDLYQPASYRGNVLKLHYAIGKELEPWLNLTAAQGEVFVQFWLKPGDPPIEFSPGEEKPVNRIPPQLREVLRDIRKIGW
jgi:inner membrane protein